MTLFVNKTENTHVRFSQALYDAREAEVKEKKNTHVNSTPLMEEIYMALSCLVTAYYIVDLKKFR